MKYILLFFSLFCAVEMRCQSIDSLVDNISKIPVYIIGKRISSTLINGKEYQIWYKNTTTNKLFPSTISSSGTGFFVSYRDCLYLVTAAHVANSIPLESEIIVGGDSSKPLHFKIIDLVKDSNVTWVFSDKADVAVLPIHPESQIGNDTTLQFIPVEWFFKSLVSPLRNKPTIMFGFPMRYGIEKRISALSMSAFPASGILDLKRADNDSIASFFLLDAPSVPGISGGPVFTLPAKARLPQAYIQVADSLNCVGLVHGVISDNTGGKFAAIVPSYFIIETIKKTKRFDGISKILHANGRPWCERKYKDGLIDEVLYNYDKNGKTLDKGTLVSGTGTVKSYDENGNLVQTIEYKEGLFQRFIIPTMEKPIQSQVISPKK